MANRAPLKCSKWGVFVAITTALAGCGEPAIDLACSDYFATTPSQLMEKAPGILHDPDTDLLWFRCNLGQTYVDGNCVGEALNDDFAAILANLEALAKDDSMLLVSNTTDRSGQLNASDINWRIPTEAEYDSLTDVPCHSPKVDVTSFLDIKTDTYYWSSSEGKNKTYACATRLKDGLRTCQTKKTNRNPTLLVASAP